MKQHLQGSNIDSSMVELFTIDTNYLMPGNTGGTIFRFTPQFQEGGTIAFGGNTYTSLPIISDGWEVDSSGTQPRPTLSVSNINKVLHGSVVSLGDLVGARITRTRTLKKFLDAASFPRRNLLNYSQDMRSTLEAGVARSWTQYSSVTSAGGGVDVAQELMTDPTGATTMVSKERCTTTGLEQRQVTQDFTSTESQVYCASVFARAAEVQALSVQVQTKATTYPFAIFNLSTGAIISQNALVASGAVNAGNGWWRLWIAVNVGIGAANTQIILQLKNTAGTDFSATAANQGLHVWGAQVELASSPSDYQFTLTSHQPYADPNSYLRPEVFEIEQKIAHNAEVIQWQLSSIIDRFGTKLPRRQVTRDIFPGVGRQRGSW